MASAKLGKLKTSTDVEKNFWTILFSLTIMSMVALKKYAPDMEFCASLAASYGVGVSSSILSAILASAAERLKPRQTKKKFKNEIR